MPHYNVMGVAKPVLDSSVQYLAWDLGQKNIRRERASRQDLRTLAARSIDGFPMMEAIVEERAPLPRRTWTPTMSPPQPRLPALGRRAET